jgi:C4-dicarboxylate transporter DctM subunit
VAAFVPGILAGIGYMLAIAVYVRVYPESGPAGPNLSWHERGRALLRVWPVAAIFLTVIGGIYGGIFTPTEAAAIGTVATALVAWLQGGLDLRGLMRCAFGAAEATAMIFLILLGADVLNVFLALTQMPVELARSVSESGLPPLLVLAAILAIYLVLGCVMDSLSMILLTVPIFLPIVMGLDFWGLNPTDKALWFGILILMVVEIGLITPPVGMNVYIINSMARDVPMMETFRGVVPFLCADAVRVTLLVFFPPLSLFLVRLIG